MKTVLRTLEDRRPPSQRAPLLRLLDDGSANLKEVTMNAATTGTVHTSLLEAIVDNDVVEVERLLAPGDIDVNSVTVVENEKRPLHVAADIGNLDIVRALLAYKPTYGNHLGEVDVNAADATGSTPLHYAVEEGHEAVVRELFTREDININATAEHKDNKTPLHIAAEKGGLGIVQALLNSRHMIDVNARDRLGRTALHYAAVGESEEVVEELLSYCKLHDLDNAPINKRRFSPRHLAALFGRDKIVSKLIAAGLPVNKTAILRYTPLHYAVHSGSWETVEVLLKESENLKVSEADWKGRTPVDYARLAYKTKENEFRPKSLPLQTSPRKDAVRMMEMLEGFDVEGLRNERQSYVDTANAILVGSALIGGIAFSSWLQPPLGFQPIYSSQFLDLSPLAPPNTYRPSVYYHGTPMILFLYFNSMSFFFAIGSFLIGAAVGFPTRYALQLVDIQQTRLLVTMASMFLISAVCCIVGAFVFAIFADLPSIPQYWATRDWGIIMLSVVGAVSLLFPLGYGMYLYLWKLYGSLGFSKDYYLRWFLGKRLASCVTEAL